VDIDPQAVEVTKLSLLLKVLEGESEQTIQPFLRLFQQRALPDLGDNIKCGNSLIGPDYFNGYLISDPEELSRVNPLDWQREFFPVIKESGFDCIIGNPPYGATLFDSEVRYLQKQFKNESHSLDTYEF
jgi:hypothetical protein